LAIPWSVAVLKMELAMLKRAALTFTELALWVAALSMLVSGCTPSGTGSKQAAAAKPSTTAAANSANQPADKPNSMDNIPLIPREVLFGNPKRAQARLSHDGKWISFQAPVDGVLNIWVGPSDDLTKAQPVSDEKVRPIPTHSWAYDNQHILYVQDKNGDENFHLYAIDVTTRKTTDLTPIQGVRAELQEVSEKFPNEVLVGLNDRDSRFHDIWRVNIETGEKTLVQQNSGVAAYVTDDNFDVRLSLTFTPTGGVAWKIAEGVGDAKTWKDFLEFDSEDTMTSGPAGFDKSAQTLYLQDSRDRNTSGLFAIDLKTGDAKLIAEDPRTDVGGALAHPTEKNIQAVSFTYARTEWKVLDPAIAPDIEFLKKFQDGDFIVTSRTQDDSQWTVAYTTDNGPVKFYRYVRGSGEPAVSTPERKMVFLFNSRDDLGDYPLVKMHDRVIKSRDGLDLVCYLTLPPASDPDGDGVPDPRRPVGPRRLGLQRTSPVAC
jgi:dipeptidyl aminopeptidase/acylaminoacyl peptidase